VLYFCIAGAKVGFIFEFAIARANIFKKSAIIFLPAVDYRLGKEG
jgi:hypothetical protein